MSKYKLENTDYQLIFPQNLEKYKNLKLLALEFEKCIKNTIISSIPRLSILKNLDLQSDEILDELAFQFSIDNWDEKIDRNKKIKLIKAAYWAHSKKGTRRAIENEINKLGYKIKLLEWWEYGGNPYTYRILSDIDNNQKNMSWATNIINAIDKIKNVRSVLDVIAVNKEESFPGTIIGYKTMTIYKDIIKPPSDKMIKSTLNIIAYKEIIGGRK